MALLLNEEQQYLKDTAKDFVQKNAPINHFRELSPHCAHLKRKFFCHLKQNLFLFFQLS